MKCCRVCNQLNHFQVSSEGGGTEVKFCPIMLINREMKPNQGRHGQRRCHVEICVHLTGPLYIRPSAWWCEKYHFWGRLVFSMKERVLKQKQLFTIKCHKMRLAKVLTMSMTSVVSWVAVLHPGWRAHLSMTPVPPCTPSCVGPPHSLEGPLHLHPAVSRARRQR